MAASDQTFQGLADRIKADLDRLDSTTEAAIKRSIVRTLQRVRMDRFLFTEASDTFTLVADQQAYSKGSGATEVPADLLYIDVARLLRSNAYDPLTKIGLNEFRDLDYGTSDRGAPQYWMWHNAQFHLYPTPSAADTIALDYHKDSSLDSTGGTLTVDSTTETNDWLQFSGGEGLLYSEVVIDLALGYLKDPAMAEMHAARADYHRKALQREYAQAVTSRLQVRPWF
jgi:hypothetical protein